MNEENLKNLKDYLNVSDVMSSYIRFLATDQRMNFDRLAITPAEKEGLTAFLNLMDQAANNYDASNYVLRKVIAVAEANLETDKAING